VNGQLNFEPSAWRVREMLSYDLPILWPRIFGEATRRFFESDRGQRDRFLERTGVRYRILPPSQAGGRVPLARLPYFWDSYLYDWGPVAPRVSIVADARVQPDASRQLDALFEPGWDSNRSALVERIPDPAGVPGPAEPPSASIVSESTDSLQLEASVGNGGGYLLVLDSYTPDWQVVVDGRPAQIVRANALFRAVRLAPGTHRVAFRYRPRAFYAGTIVTGFAALAVLGLAMMRHRPRIVPAPVA
jgi:hypothetical protein